MAEYKNPTGVSPLPHLDGVPGITLPGDFALESADRSLNASKDIGSKKENDPLEHGRFPIRNVTHYGEAIARLVGAYSGPGFNLIFRPHADKNLTGALKDLILPDDDLLELNLTHELWSFPTVGGLGEIPNRVAKAGPLETKPRNNVSLRGIPYTQIVRDVTATSKEFKGQRIPVNRLGKADGKIQSQVQDIHFEPGLLIHVPKSTPVSDEATLSRMASIPHGTSINAQGLAATKTVGKNKPDIPEFNANASRPFFIDTGIIVPFDTTGKQFDLDSKTATRLPQDLEPFFNQSSITKEMVQDPNELIRKHNENKDFSQVIKFKVSTLPEQQLSSQSCPHLAARSALKAARDSIRKSIATATDKPTLEKAQKTLDNAIALIDTPSIVPKPKGTDAVQIAAREAATAPAIGTANIAFLDGDLGNFPNNNPNAKTAKVESTFWISTVVYIIEMTDNFTPGGNVKLLGPLDPVPNAKGSWAKDTVPQFVFPADQKVEKGKYSVEATQIQYSQTVDLLFNTLAWPHISVATLVPVRPVVVNFAKKIG
jgi:hypothetical protein